MLEAASVPSNVVGFGDSLTTSLGYGTQFPLLRPSKTFDMQGVGGQNSSQIVARFGAVPITLTLTGNSIPTSGGVVVSAINEPNPFYHWNSTSGSLWGSIAGVKGILSYSSGTITFTRLVPGSAVSVSSNVAFVPLSGVDQSTVSCSGVNNLPIIQNWTVVLLMGTNDVHFTYFGGGPAVDYNTRLSNIAAAVANVKSGRYIVLGLTAGEYWLTAARSSVGGSPSDAATISALNEIAATNAALAAAYGKQFFNTQTWALSLGQSNVWTVGSNSYTLVNQTVMTDGIHFTGTGYAAQFASAIDSFLKTLGW